VGLSTSRREVTPTEQGNGRVAKGKKIRKWDTGGGGEGLNKGEKGTVPKRQGKPGSSTKPVPGRRVRVCKREQQTGDVGLVDRLVQKKKGPRIKMGERGTEVANR